MVVGVGAHGVDAVHRLPRGVGRTRRILVAARRLDVGADVAREQPVTAAAEDRHQVPRLAARRLFTAEVVREPVVERRGQFRFGAHELVVDRDRVGNEARATARPRVQAEQADEVGTVGVEREGDRADLVAPTVRIVERAALVGDVTEQMALRVLRPRTPEVHADAPVDRRRALLAVVVGRQAADEHDPAAVDQLVLNARELGTEGREREVVACDVEHVVAVCLGVLQRMVELGEMRIGELEDVVRVDVVASPLTLHLEWTQLRSVDRRHRAAPPGAGWAPRRRRPGSGPVASPFS